jgi:hypothetical protein
MHFIDLRDAQNVGHAVQCNCEYFGRRTPGTPRNKDETPLPGGGIQCCGDGSAGPVTAAAAGKPPLPVALLYNVTWLPNTAEALAGIPKSAEMQLPLFTATLQSGSSADGDAASCAGEYNARPCTAAYEAKWKKEIEAMSDRARIEKIDRAPEPRNQTCGATAADGSGAKVTVVGLHKFANPVDP